MPGPFKMLRQYFDSEKERDKVYRRQLTKNFEIHAGHRTIKKITRSRKGQGPRYGYEIKRV